MHSHWRCTASFCVLQFILLIADARLFWCWRRICDGDTSEESKTFPSQLRRMKLIKRSFTVKMFIFLHPFVCCWSMTATQIPLFFFFFFYLVANHKKGVNMLCKIPCINRNYYFASLISRWSKAMSTGRNPSIASTIDGGFIFTLSFCWMEISQEIFHGHSFDALALLFFMECTRKNNEEIFFIRNAKFAWIIFTSGIYTIENGT